MANLCRPTQKRARPDESLNDGCKELESFLLRAASGDGAPAEPLVPPAAPSAAHLLGVRPRAAALPLAGRRECATCRLLSSHSAQLESRRTVIDGNGPALMLRCLHLPLSARCFQVQVSDLCSQLILMQRPFLVQIRWTQRPDQFLIAWT